MNSPDPDDVIEGEVLPHLPSGKLSHRHLRRIDVVQAFHTAFEMIGGVPRLALWADNNPTEFYKLYGRLLPSAAQSELAPDDKITIEHALPPPLYNPADEPLPLPAPEPSIANLDPLEPSQPYDLRSNGDG